MTPPYERSEGGTHRLPARPAAPWYSPEKSKDSPPSNPPLDGRQTPLRTPLPRPGETPPARPGADAPFRGGRRPPLATRSGALPRGGRRGDASRLPDIPPSYPPAGEKNGGATPPFFTPTLARALRPPRGSMAPPVLGEPWGRIWGAIEGRPRSRSAPPAPDFAATIAVADPSTRGTLDGSPSARARRSPPCRGSPRGGLVDHPTGRGHHGEAPPGRRSTSRTLSRRRSVRSRGGLRGGRQGPRAPRCLPPRPGPVHRQAP